VQLSKICDKYFANLCAGIFFQLIIDLIGVFGLCNFIVAWRFVVLESSLYISMQFQFV
jgi:hypothetical protein